MKNIIFLLILILTSSTTFSQDSLSTDKNFNSKGTTGRLRFAINGGYSYMPKQINRITPTPNSDYSKKLQSGYNFGIDGGYYFKESDKMNLSFSMGVGFKFNMFGTSNETENLQFNDLNGNTQIGKISDDIKILYFGPTYLTRMQTLNNKNTFIFGLSIGYISYTNNFVYDDSYKMTGNDIGFVVELAYDRKITEIISLGFQVSSVSSHLINYEIDDGTRSQKYNITEVDNERIYLDHLDFALNFIIHL